MTPRLRSILDSSLTLALTSSDKLPSHHAALQGFLENYGTPAIALLLLLSGIGLPLPEDIPLLAAGYICGQGAARLEMMIPLCLFCVIGADSGLFLLGRRYGHHVPNLPVIGRFLSAQRITLAEQKMQKHGGKTLFIARFLPGLRAPIFFASGACGVPYWKFLAFDGGAALLSVPTLILVAFFFSDHIDQVRHWTAEAQFTLLGIMAVLLAGYVALKVLRNRRLHQQTVLAGSAKSSVGPV